MSLTGMLLGAYGIKNPTEKIALPEFKVADISDIDAVRIYDKGLPGEEQCFLALHAKVLKQSGFEKTKNRVLAFLDVAQSLWNSLSLGLKIFFVVFAIIVGIFLLIPFAGMMFAVLTDIVTMAHVLMLFMLALVIFIASTFV